MNRTKGELPPVDEHQELEIQPSERLGYLTLLRVLFRHYPTRSILGGVLMITQSFLYNAIFFTSGLVLEFFFKVKATTQTLCRAVIFFFASAGASAGYLTVSEVFPLEVRAQAIAVFFAIAQVFGLLGSHWYGHLIGNGQDRNTLYAGYIVGGGAMILGGIVAIFFGVAAEGKSLEDVATPLSVIAKPAQTIFRAGDHPAGPAPSAGD